MLSSWLGGTMKPGDGAEPMTREMQLRECWPVLTDHKQTGGCLFSNCSGNTNQGVC